MINVAFGITVASFFTSILYIWHAIGSDVIGKFYQLYFYAFIAAVMSAKTLDLSLDDKVTRTWHMRR